MAAAAMRQRAAQNGTGWEGGGNQPEVAAAVVAAAVRHHRGSVQRTMELAGIKGKKINRRWQRQWWRAGSCHATSCSAEWNWLEKKKKQSTGGGSGGGGMAALLKEVAEKNQPKVAAAVVEWRPR